MKKLLAGCIALALLAAWLFHERGHEPLRPSVTSSSLTPSPSPMQAATSPTPSPSSISKPANLWKMFQKKFGPDLNPQFNSKGHLESLKGSFGNGLRGAPDFDPKDPKKSIMRANEVIDGARGLLGIQADLPLLAPLAKNSPATTQVAFREGYDGIPLEPPATITVDLGPQGELLGLWSSYTGDVIVINSRTLDLENARSRAQTAVEDTPSASTIKGGREVIWVDPRKSDAAPQGHRAYEFYVQGRQVIVDASNGKILSKRDRRQF